MPHPALFLDRDGTLIEDVGYLSKPEQITILPGVVAALQQLTQMGYLLIVVTNQSGIGRGYFTEADFHCTTQALDDLFRMHGIHILETYFCPHHPESGQEAYQTDCSCRKPKPGMLIQAASDHSIDLRKSWMIGDRLSDIQAGKEVHCRTILLNPTKATTSADVFNPSLVVPDFEVSNLSQAAQLILQNG